MDGRAVKQLIPSERGKIEGAFLYRAFLKLRFLSSDCSLLELHLRGVERRHLGLHHAILGHACIGTPVRFCQIVGFQPPRDVDRVSDDIDFLVDELRAFQTSELARFA